MSSSMERIKQRAAKAEEKRILALRLLLNAQTLRPFSYL